MQPGILYIEPKTILASWIQELKADGYNSAFLSHFGSLNQDLLNSFTESTEDFMISCGEKKTLVKRMFSILIEGLQNILIHGHKIDNEIQALLLIAQKESSYKVVLGNITNKSDTEKLIGYIERLNAMNEDEVKEFYLQTLNNGLISEKGGAGLGFITIRMKSKAQLQYRFKDLTDDQSLFTIAAVLEKE